MAKINQPLSWTTNSGEPYIPILHEGEVIGLCKPDYAKQIVDTLNNEERLRKALQLACYDLFAKSGATTSIDDLMQHYLTKAEQPKSGTGIVALLLLNRQEELDLTDEEFAKFCDTFRLSRAELKGIYAGVEIENTQLSPLSRILGMTIDELIDVWQGKR